MGQCSQCGSSVPNGQSICSMCMGDINHGKDGYYQQWAEEQERERHEYEQQQWEQQHRYEEEQNAQAEAEFYANNQTEG